MFLRQQTVYFVRVLGFVKSFNLASNMVWYDLAVSFQLLLRVSNRW
jgi:hypothetical protein